MRSEGARKHLRAMIRLLFLFFALSVNAFALSPLFSQRRCVRLSESSYATASARVQLRESIQEPKRRRETIDGIMKGSMEELKTFTPRELKTALALCVDMNSDSLLRSFIRKLHAARILSTELMTITLRLASRKRNASLAACVLRETRALGYATDIDNINSVAELLAESNQHSEIIDVVRDVQKGAFGEELVCDAMLYSHLLESSSRQKTGQPLVDACRLIDKQRSFGKVKTDERTFMDVLNVCLLKNDLSGALRVHELFVKLHGFVQTRVYAVILSIYLGHTETSAGGAVREDERTAVGEMVQEVLNSKLANNPVIADLLLRYYSLGCSNNIISDATNSACTNKSDVSSPMSSLESCAAAGSAYLLRLWDEFHTVPGALALSAYTDAVLATASPARATLLYQYYRQHQRVPPASLAQLSLLSNDGDPATRVKKLAAAVSERFWHPLRVEEQSALAHTILREVAPALVHQCGTMEGGLNDVSSALQVVRRLVDEGWHMLAMEELMSEYLVPVVRILDDCDDGGDVKKPGIELLKQLIDTWICADIKKHAAATELLRTTEAVEYAPSDGMLRLGSYFDIVKTRLELDSVSAGTAVGAPPDQLAAAGMLLLARLVLQAGAEALYEEVRRVLQRSGVHEVVQVVPWLDAACTLQSQDTVAAEAMFQRLVEEEPNPVIRSGLCSAQAVECTSWVRGLFCK